MRSLSRRGRGLALAASVLTVAALAATTALANHYPGNFPEMSYPYTQEKDGDCKADAVDPINVAWRGSDGGISNVQDLLVQHADWGNRSGSEQNLKVHDNPSGYDCKTQGEQRSDGSNFENTRYHTRLWFIPNSRDEPEKKTVGDAHFEELQCPGHKTVSFDAGRDRVINRMSNAGHSLNYDYWGNSRSFRQCDGDYVGSGGAGYYIGAGHRH